jgi:hypothetical protein
MRFVSLNTELARLQHKMLFTESFYPQVSVQWVTFSRKLSWEFMINHWNCHSDMLRRRDVYHVSKHPWASQVINPPHLKFSAQGFLQQKAVAQSVIAGDWIWLRVIGLDVPSGLWIRGFSIRPLVGKAVC